MSPQTSLIIQLSEFINRWLCFLYGDPMPSIGVYIKLNEIPTRTDLGHKPQWKKWRKIQIWLGNLVKSICTAKSQLGSVHPVHLLATSIGTPVLKQQDF